MTKPRIIGIYSPSPQSGKTTVGLELQQRGYMSVSFAGPLKRMLAVFLSSAGYGHEQIEALLFEGKEGRIPEFGVSARHLMQTLGTEWGRECISPDVWVEVWKNAVMKWIDGGNDVVVDDVRFPNEYQAIKQLGGEMWYVTRGREPRLQTNEHASEGALETHGFDHRLVNDGTVTDLHNQIAKALSDQPVLL